MTAHALLADHLSSAALIARRLARSHDRVGALMPLDETRLAALSEQEQEAVEALLFRYVSLLGLVQDQLFRAILTVQEEDQRDRTRRDQRLFMEKIGALPPGVDFGALALVRNRVTHQYPSRPARQVATVNEVHLRSADLLRAYEAVAAYAQRVLTADPTGDGGPSAERSGGPNG